MKVCNFLNSPEKWTQDAYARNALGFEVDANDPSAVSWNLSGAINYCYFLTVPLETKTEEYKKSLAVKMHKIIEIINTPDVWAWEMEPQRTFEEIKKVITQVDI